MYGSNPEVSLVTNLDDPGQPCTCQMWGEMHNNPTLILDNVPGGYLAGLFAANDFPAIIVIDH